MEENLKAAEVLLGDLSGYRSFHKDAYELLDELKAWRREQYDEWSREVQQQIDDPHQPLRCDNIGITSL